MKIRDLKRNAKSYLKSNYFKCILVTIIISIVLGGTYIFNRSSLDFSSRIFSEDYFSDFEDEKIRERLKEELSENIKTSINNNIENLNYIKNEAQNLNDENKEEVIGNIVNKISKEKKTLTFETATRGILAPIVNKIAISSSPLANFYNAFKLLIINHDIISGLISLFACLFSVFLYVVIKTLIEVGKNRFFLETRIYKNTKSDKLLYIFRTKRKRSVALTLFAKNVFLFLWNFTLIGGFIKKYEYYMIGYILAENPSITRKEAFKTSKEMMKGYKFKAFLVDLSLIGWDILAFLTLGISDIFFSRAYKELIYAELYATIRSDKLAELTYKELLDDNLLFENIEGVEEYPETKLRVSSKNKVFNIDYEQKYPLKNLILIFFTTAFIGWLWEVFLILITKGKFVNRGTMFGPWLPIYGFGGIIILLLLKPVRSKPVRFFILAMIISGIVEYFTSYVLELLCNKRWWDYSGYFLNLDGRICLEGLLVFALGGIAITYFVGPLLNNIYSKIDYKKSTALCCILLVLFGLDIAYSVKHPNTGEGITEEKVATY